MVLGARAVGQVEKVLTVRQELGPQVGPVQRAIHVRHPRWHAAGCRHAEERPLTVWGEKDDVVLVPRAASALGRVADRLDVPSGDRHHLEPAAGEEADESGVGRPEWKRRFVRSWNRPRRHRDERPDPQLRSVRPRRRERQVASVWRQRAGADDRRIWRCNREPHSPSTPVAGEVTDTAAMAASRQDRAGYHRSRQVNSAEGAAPSARAGPVSVRNGPALPPCIDLLLECRHCPACRADGGEPAGPRAFPSGAPWSRRAAGMPRFLSRSSAGRREKAQGGGEQDWADGQPLEPRLSAQV